MLDGRRRQGRYHTHEGEGSDSSSVHNKALAVNVLLPGMLQGHNLHQMLEAGAQLVVEACLGREGGFRSKRHWTH